MAKPKPAAAPADAVAPKKGKLLLVLPVVAAVLGTALGATQAGRLAGLVGGHAPAAEAAPAEAEAAAVEFGEFHEIKGLIVNPAGSGGRRFLLVDVALESETPEALEELKTRDVVVRDIIVGALARLSVEQLAAPGARETLKDAILAHVNDALGPAAEVRRLYFTQYVLQ
jgi:flagellar FliL protein